MRRLAWALAVAGAAATVLVVTFSWLAGTSAADLISSYSLTNTAFGVCFGAAGFLLAHQRPRNPIGWLFLGGALGHLVTAACAAVGIYGMGHGWPPGLLRTLATVFYFTWPAGIGLAFPLALVLFPTGRPLNRFWRWFAWFVAAHGIVFVVRMGLQQESLVDPALPRPYGVLADDNPVFTVLGAMAIAQAVALFGAVVALVMRYRAGDEKQRRQLLWLTLAMVLAAALNSQRWVTDDGPILLLLSFQLIPVAVVIAILRYQLLDIRLVFSRTVLYLLLTLGVVAGYAALVTVFGLFVSGFGRSSLAAIVLALAFNPVRLRLQRLVDRLFYGDRDPMRAVSQIGDGDLSTVVASLATALRLPSVSVRAGNDVVASHGDEPERTEVVALRYGGEEVGELVAGVRTGQARLAAADRRVLELVGGVLAVALHATALAGEVAASRGRIVAAVEEERRRLRRDLHDGLGPTLTGVAYKIDAARNGLRSDPDTAEGLLRDLRAETGGAIDDIRRLVYGLRPPALDELGLVGALKQQAGRLSGALAVTVDAPAALPELPAAVEVAAYRIATEALTNAARHTAGGHVTLTVSVDGALHVEVRDGGDGIVDAWPAGVGMASMRERAAEVGGTVEVGPTASGGVVAAMLPLA